MNGDNENCSMLSEPAAAADVVRNATVSAPAPGGDPRGVFELTLAILRNIAATVRHDAASPWKTYWKEEGVDAKDENDCRDVLVYDLNNKLEQRNMTARAETRSRNDGRADIGVFHGRLILPIEIKRQMHSEVWTALKDQLADGYMREPSSGGFGIYVVFWFRKDFKIPNPPDGFVRPTTALEMEGALTKLVPPDGKERLAVVVIDVSPPDGFKPGKKTKAVAKSPLALTRALGRESPDIPHAERGVAKDYAVRRAVEDDAIAWIDNPTEPRWLAITGHSGVGKSTLLNQLADARRDVLLVVVSATDLLAAPLTADVVVKKGDTLAANLTFLQKEFVGASPPEGKWRFVVIDTLDAIANSGNNLQTTVDFIKSVLNTKNTALITTSRKGEFDELRLAGGWSAGGDCQSLELGDFNADERDRAIARYIDFFAKPASDAAHMEIRERLTRAELGRRNISRILSHPLTLRLLFQLYPNGDFPPDLRVVDLYETFWRRKVCAAGTRVSALRKEGVVRFIAARMMITRTNRISSRGGLEDAEKELGTEALRQCLTDLQSENILLELGRRGACRVRRGDGADDTWLGDVARPESIEFFHDTFQEFAAAKVIAACDGDLVTALARHVDAEVDLRAREVLIVAVVLKAASMPSVIVELFDHASTLTSEAAVSAWMQLTYPTAEKIFQPFSSALFATQNRETGDILSVFLDDCVNLPGNRLWELFDLDQGILTRIVRDPENRPLFPRVMAAVGALARHPSDTLMEWMKWAGGGGVAVTVNQGQWQTEFVDACVALTRSQPELAAALLWGAVSRYGSLAVRSQAMRAWADLPAAVRRPYRDRIASYVANPPTQDREKPDATLSRLLAKAWEDVSDNRSTEAAALFQKIVEKRGRRQESTLHIFALTVPTNERGIYFQKILENIKNNSDINRLRDFCCKYWLNDIDHDFAAHLGEMVNRGMMEENECWTARHLTHAPTEIVKHLPLPERVLETLNEERTNDKVQGTLFRLMARMADRLPKEREHAERFIARLRALKAEHIGECAKSLPDADSLSPQLQEALLTLCLELAVGRRIKHKEAAGELLLKVHVAFNSPNRPLAAAVQGFIDNKSGSHVKTSLLTLSKLPASIWSRALPDAYISDAFQSSETGIRLAATKAFHRLIIDRVKDVDVSLEQVDWSALWRLLTDETDGNGVKIGWECLEQAIQHDIPGAIDALNVELVSATVSQYASKGKKRSLLNHVWRMLRAWGAKRPKAAFDVLCLLLPMELGREGPRLIESMAYVTQADESGYCINELVRRLKVTDVTEVMVQTRLAHTLVKTPLPIIRKTSGLDTLSRDLIASGLCGEARRLIEKRNIEALRSVHELGGELKKNIESAAALS